jgi:L-asparagine oxygenase
MLKMVQTCADPGGIDGFVLDNLPHGDPGAAPTNGRRPKTKSGESEAVVLGIIYAALCFVLGYNQEKRGDLVHQVAPIRGEEALQSNGSRTKFGWHIDNAFLPLLFQPQYLALFGLVNERDVPTLLLSLAKDILPALPSELLRRLETSLFLLPAPHSFDFGGRQVVTQPRPVIYKDEHGIVRIALPRSDYIQPDPLRQGPSLNFASYWTALHHARL